MLTLKRVIFRVFRRISVSKNTLLLSDYNLLRLFINLSDTLFPYYYISARIYLCVYNLDVDVRGTVGNDSLQSRWSYFPYPLALLLEGEASQSSEAQPPTPR